MTITASAKPASRLTSRRVSDLSEAVQKPAPQTPDQVDDESSSDEARIGRKRPRDDRPKMARLVSYDAQYISENEDDVVVPQDKKEKHLPMPSSKTEHPPLPNPLYTSNLLSAHIRSLRLEAELFPMRTQVARLMAHPTHNRRGLFNVPVDTVALGLVDYHLVVTKPMDLGTIKAKVHALSYNTRDEVADEIRLVFLNSMKYNPPNNTVHIAAMNLLRIFEEAYEVMKATTEPVVTRHNASCPTLPVSAPPRGVVARSASMAPMNAASVLADQPPAQSPAEATTSQPALATEASAKNTPESATKSTSDADPLAASTSPRHVSMVGPAVPSMPVTEPPIAASPGKVGLRRGSFCGLVGENPFAAPPPAEKALKRAMNVAAKHAKHSCRSCVGRTCGICRQGCLNHEPALLICTGTNCLGAKIRKGAVYYIAKDGSRQFCQRCYTNLQAVLPHTRDQADAFGSSVRYKRDLLKRKNEEEVAEAWLTCKTCQKGVHKICAMHNEFVHSEEDYECPSCVTETVQLQPEKQQSMQVDSDYYTFISGSEVPVKLDEVMGTGEVLPAESLPETPISAFIQARVRDCIATTGIADAEKTVTVRIISDCSKNFKVPDVVRQHFRQRSQHESGVKPPTRVNYNSKAITLFQKIDGLDVCIFCMYVQEYDCKDNFENGDEGEQKKRVYVAYLDSVAHFRPRECRTEVFHEILVAYLATARVRGYESAHIWACPPSRGNSFVFWNHPSSQRTPSKERLISWYHGALSRGIDSGVITNVSSLFESAFPLTTTRSTDPVAALNPENMTICEDGVLAGRMTCPPLMDGDYWIEEAVRVHATNIVRHLKSKPTRVECVDGGCPAAQVATIIRDRVMIEKCASPFKKPVNAAALKLTDYHKIIKHPMDLGTVYSRCVLGEFETLSDVVSDVELVFSNAMKYNPKGHVVHNMAVETRELFFKELNEVVKQWPTEAPTEEPWKAHSDVSMNLDNIFEIPTDVDIIPSVAATVPAGEAPTAPDAVDAPSARPTEAPAASDANPMSIDTKAIETAQLADNQSKENAFCIPESPPLNPITPPAEKPMKPLSTVLITNAIVKPPAQVSPPSLKKSAKALHALMNQKLELLSGGHDAILQRMVGDDVWMMDKKCINPPKATGAGKKKGAGKNTGKRRKSPVDTASVEEPPTKRRRQSWLGEEVGLSVRRMRTSFFSCSLVPEAAMTSEEEAKERDFKSYMASFFESTIPDEPLKPCRIADARHALLEFSQYRNLEFDTLRRAKYSTSVLLYHLHYDDAPGLIPSCSSCTETIQEIRWHRIRRVEERHHTGRVPPTLRAARMAQIAVPPEAAEACHKGEELCACCFDKRSNKEEFIPLPISLKA